MMTAAPLPPLSGKGMVNARPPIDWATVHQRLARLAAAVERGWMPEAAEQRRILEVRASALARPPASESLAPAMEVLEFRLAGERHGLACPWVREVLPLAGLTRLPGTPAFVLGIINLRGEIVSVLDLKECLGLAGKGEEARPGAILILESADMRFGILADAIVGVVTVASEALQPGLAPLGGGRENYLLGITRERLAVLDGARLLADPRLVVHETVEP